MTVTVCDLLCAEYRRGGRLLAFGAGYKEALCHRPGARRFPVQPMGLWLACSFQHEAGADVKMQLVSANGAPKSSPKQSRVEGGRSQGQVMKKLFHPLMTSRCPKCFRL